MSGTLTSIATSSDRTKPSGSLRIEVIADMVCPYCFVGKRRFDAALKAVQGPVEVSWHPYQLNPDFPADGLPFDVYLTRKFQTPAKLEPILQHLIREGDDVGIRFRFDKIRQVPSTLVIHQVMQLAETLGVDQTALAEDLMSAFFEYGLDIGDRRTLVGIATAHGISALAVEKAIASDKLKRIVVAREEHVRNSGLAGVPGFLVNRRLLVVGAQETDSIVNAFDRAMFGEGGDALTSPVLH